MGKNENNILYIDDEQNNLLLFEAMFSRYYNIHLASSAKQAETIIAENEFKVIVSDINMPEESGLTFFSRLPKTNTSPVLIILTAYLSDKLLLEAINQDKIFRYITKPLERDKVKDILDQAIHIYNLRHENHQLYLQILESQQNFYKIFQSSNDGIAILDENEIILEANNAFHKGIKTNSNNIVGLKLQDVIPPKIHTDLLGKFSKLFETPISLNEFEYYSPTEGGKKIIELNSSVIDYKGKKAILIIVRDITERRNNELKLLNAVVGAEELERSRLAKDLHDGLGPILSSLKMYLEWLNKQDKITDHPDIVNLSVKSINEAIVTLKRISNNLSPHILEKFGLSAALNKYIDSIKKISNLEFKVSINITDALELGAKMSLYRILTECITNTLKHAEASLVEIKLWQENQIIFLKYHDDGKGFSFKEIENKISSMGLHNITNRIKTLGGKSLIESFPGAGFKLYSEIPI
jgi:PAS domain S-box-containing protein